MSKHTPGPWGWFGDAKQRMYLATEHSGRQFVMDFVRMGMRGAQPRFQVDHRMVNGQELCQFEVAPKVVGVTAAQVDGSGVYRDDIIGFDHPDARLIAAAPELLETLQEVIRITDRKHDAWDRAKAAIAKATA